jgi:hypothetical protein
VQEDQQTNLKWTATLFIEFYLASDTTSVTDPPPAFRSEPFVLLSGMASEDLLTQLQAAYNFFILSAEIFTGQGSGYVVSKLVRLEISTIVYDPIRTGKHISLPNKLSAPKKGLLNIESRDDRCLLYCLVAWIKLKNGTLRRNRTRLAHYSDPSDHAMLDMTGDINI